jgi:hypothetical protein
MDLKSELMGRLASLDKKIEMENLRHEAIMDKYARNRATVLAMIDIETSEQNPQEDMFVISQGPKREVTPADLEREILSLLKTQNNWPHAALKEFLIRGGLGKSDDPQFGRRVHGTLMSLRHRGIVEQSAPATWTLASQSAEAS